jgi:uncharacterized protein (DUF2141 family)
MSSIIKYIVFVILSLILYTCANQQAPPGGPKDTIPPEIIYIYPENGSLNFSEKYFEIDFSEYVDKLSLLDAFFVSPEIKNIEYDWSGTSVTISFDDTLTENTTYTISIGSGIKDLNNQNPMLNAMNISFSTGSIIDTGSISGSVFHKDINGTMILAYQKVDTFANPIEVKAQNITQVGENGEYQLLGLKNGEYRIFAIKDANGNRIYNIGEDTYGVTSHNIFLTDSLNKLTDINFKLTKEDTLAPYISSVTMTDNYHLTVEYSEPLDSTKINANNFFIIDSLSNEKTNVKFLYQGNKRKYEYVLVLSDTLKNEDSNYLIGENIFDKYLNVTGNEAYGFIASSKKDTLAPEIKSVSTPFASKKIDFLSPEFTITFNDAIDADSLLKSLNLGSLKFSMLKENDAEFKVLILDKIDSNQKIEFIVDRNILYDVAGNNIDSLQKYELETLSGREFSGLSGKIITEQKQSVVVIENLEDENLKYSTIVDDGLQYSFERVLPGKYKLWLYEDSDLNKKYNYGQVVPFELSEKFIYYKDTLNLRARWPIGDVDIKID